MARREGLTEELARCVGDYESEQFTPAERVAIRYAELLAANHKAIDEELFAELGEHFTEEQILELGWAAAAFIGFGRLIDSYGCLPEAHAASAR